MKLLRIDASARISESTSRKLADAFCKKWMKKYGSKTITIRDIINTPISHINQTTIQGFYTAPDARTSELEQALEISDLLIKELKSCDALLISSPMYNFGTPSALKAWIDHIIRINETFGVAQDNSFYGMVTDKKAYIITSAGAVYSNKQMEAYDFLTPYLKTVLGLIGITDVKTLPLEGTTLAPETFEQTQQKAITFIENL